jgi:capsular polysaccharide biosynthesis protein
VIGECRDHELEALSTPEGTFMDDTQGIQWYFSVIRRWWWLIVGCGLLAAVSAFVVSSWLSPVYRATTTLLVDQAQVTGNTEYNNILASERKANTYSQMLKGQPVLEATIAQLELNESPNTLAERMEVRSVPDTQLIRVAVKDTDPAQAALIANTVTKLFVNQIQALQAERYAESLASTKEQMDGLTA